MRRGPVHSLCDLGPYRSFFWCARAPEFVQGDDVLAHGRGWYNRPGMYRGCSCLPTELWRTPRHPSCVGAYRYSCYLRRGDSNCLSGHREFGSRRNCLSRRMGRRGRPRGPRRKKACTIWSTQNWLKSHGRQDQVIDSVLARTCKFEPHRSRLADR